MSSLPSSCFGAIVELSRSSKFLLLLGMGGLVLVLLCSILYASRRQRYFLYWTFAVLCGVLWRLGTCMRLYSDEVGRLSDADRRLIGYLAGLAGVWHIALWGLGVLAFRERLRPLVDVATRGVPLARALISTRVTYAVLLLAASADTIGYFLFDWPLRYQLISIAAVVVYGLSAVWFARRRLWPISVLQATILGFIAVVHGIDALRSAGTIVSVVSVGLEYAAFLDFVRLALLVGGMLVVLFDDGQHELQMAHQRLAESEDRLRLLFDHGGVGLALLSPDGFFLESNPAVTSVLGYSEAELRGRRLGDLTHPEDRTLSSLRRSEPAARREQEKRFIHKDGRVVWARLVRVPVRNGHGTVRYHVTVLIDVTERRKAEADLATSEQRLRQRVEQAFDGIAVWSMAGDFLEANPALCRLLGQSPSELLRLRAVDAAIEHAEMRAHLERVRLAGADRCELHLRRRVSEGTSGAELERVIVEISSASVESDGELLIQGILRDVTERKRAERALRQAEEVVRQERDFREHVLQTADALIVVVDDTGRIVHCNAKVEALIGRSEDSVRGQFFWDCFVPDRLQLLVQVILRHLLQTGKQGVPPGTPLPPDVRVHRDTDNPEVEAPFLAADGTERVVLWRASLLGDTPAHPRYALGVGLDVTDRRRLEEHAAHARKMETLTTLVAGIAHDFNNQLTTILGNLHLTVADLQRQHDTTVPASREALEGMLAAVHSAESAAQECAGITARLRVFSEGHTVAAGPANLRAIAHETARLLQHDLPPNITVQVEAAEDLWPAAVDPARVQEVLLNLASNAREAMPEGGTLTVRARNCLLGQEVAARNLDARAGQFVELSVEDTGEGMSSVVQRRIFEPMFSTRSPGRGMGLAVVFGTVRAHQGWVEVNSEVGRGSTFRVYLPALPACRTEGGGLRTETEALSPQSSALSSERRPACVLVVDDEPMVRNLARAILQRDGLQVRLAADGAEALREYEEHTDEIDLILLDYTMPKLTGLQVLRQLREKYPKVRVIFSSGYVLDHEVQQFLDAGARAFIAKPYRPQDLLQQVCRVLQEAP
jgi:PAS domain S-box-containing protein